MPFKVRIDFKCPECGGRLRISFKDPSFTSAYLRAYCPETGCKFGTDFELTRIGQDWQTMAEDLGAWLRFFTHIVFEVDGEMEGKF